MTLWPGHKLFKMGTEAAWLPIQKAKEMGAETLIKVERNTCVFCVHVGGRVQLKMSQQEKSCYETLIFQKIKATSKKKKKALKAAGAIPED